MITDERLRAAAEKSSDLYLCCMEEGYDAIPPHEFSEPFERKITSSRGVAILAIWSSNGSGETIEVASSSLMSEAGGSSKPAVCTSKPRHCLRLPSPAARRTTGRLSCRAMGEVSSQRSTSPALGALVGRVGCGSRWARRSQKRLARITSSAVVCEIT